MRIVDDDAEYSGAVAVRLDDAETAALIDAIGLALARLESIAPEAASALRAADRKISSLVSGDLRGLQIHAVHHCILQPHEHEGF